MVYKIKATFAEGVTLDQINAALSSAGVTADNPPLGGISHEETSESGQVVFIDEWETRDAFETFVTKIADPALIQAGISPPEVEEL